MKLSVTIPLMLAAWILSGFVVVLGPRAYYERNVKPGTCFETCDYLSECETEDPFEKPKEIGVVKILEVKKGYVKFITLTGTYKGTVGSRESYLIGRKMESIVECPIEKP